MLKTELNIEHDYRHFCETLCLGDQETFLGVAPFYHTYGSMSFMAAFYKGGCVIVLPFFLPAPVLDAALQYNPTLFLTTPPMIDILSNCRIEAGQEKVFSNLKACICSTGHLKTAPQKLFSSRYGVDIKAQYGSTETLSATIDHDNDFEEGRVGRPYNGVEIGIFDDSMNKCPSKMHGSIGIKSPSASHCYEGDPDSTCRVFRDGYVFPGDRGFIDGSGRLHILGRSDIINIGGNKVDRLEVETVIKNSLPVRDVVVLKSQQGGLPVIKAVIEADPEKLTKTEVICVCRNQLIDYKVPRIVKIHSSLKRDTNGKILLKYLNA
jgi:long-chain acyl-CoA synthetase